MATMKKSTTTVKSATSVKKTTVNEVAEKLIINVTGHRPNKLFGYDIHVDRYDGLRHQIKLALFKLIKEYGAGKSIEVYSGMALGVDQIFVECALDARAFYKKQGVDFKINAAIPCSDQDKVWKQDAKDLYKKLLADCDNVVLVHNGPYTPSCMEERNKYMVEKSSFTIAVWDGSKGGTGNCVNDAKASGNKILRIHPKNGSINWML